MSKNNGFNLHQDASSIVVTGCVDFRNAPRLCKQGKLMIQSCKANDNMKIDFSKLTAANSALLAVLCAWLRIAASMNIKLLFVGFDKRMQSLFELCGFAALYPEIAKE